MKLRYLITTALILPIFFLFFSCKENSRVNNPESIQGSGNLVSAEPNVSECSGIKIINTGEVYLKQDTIQSVRIEADDNIIDHIITRAEGGVLNVGVKEGSYSGITVKFYISLKNITQLIAEGAGKIECTGSLKCGNLSCVINGAGRIKLIGEGDNLNCAINGAGNFDAKEFTTARCSVAVNGAGQCVVYVTDELEATVNGAGNVIYYGGPASINSSISGMGHISEGK